MNKTNYVLQSLLEDHEGLFTLPVWYRSIRLAMLRSVVGDIVNPGSVVNSSIIRTASTKIDMLNIHEPTELGT